MHSHSGRNRRRAFTLIEMTTVVLILGIIGATAAPRYLTAAASYRVQAAARRVAADLRMARDYAQRVSLSQTVDFNVAADSYAMAGVPDVDRPTQSYAVALATSQYPVDITTANFQGSNVIQFDIYGRPNRTGSVVVQSQSQQCTVQVDKVGNVSMP